MIPTTEKNIGERLFFRFCLIYSAFFVPLLLAIYRGLPIPVPADTGKFQFILLALVLLGGLTVICGTYLHFMCMLKAASDAAIFTRITQMVKSSAIGIFQWNALFLLLTLSTLLFLCTAATACRFSFSCRMRDFKLIFSKSFAQYLLRSLLFLALAVLLAFLFSRAEVLLPH